MVCQVSYRLTFVTLSLHCGIERLQDVHCHSTAIDGFKWDVITGEDREWCQLKYGLDLAQTVDSPFLFYRQSESCSWGMMA